MNSRKQKVLKASLHLFTEKGFHNTSIPDILTHANISRGTFYNYFSSKKECFLAILENSRYEASIRRHEMLEGNDKSDLNILAKQLAVMMEINQEQNLMALFQGIFQSNDEELKPYLVQHKFAEVQWLMGRLIDVYGEEARPYVYEASTILFGMVQHLSFSYRVVHETTIDSYILSQTCLRHLDAIIPKMIETGEVILPYDSIRLLESQSPDQEISIEELCERLVEFIARIPNEPNDHGEEFATILLQELQMPEPRLAVIEVLLKPFMESFKATTHEFESRQLVQMIWSMLEKLKKEKVTH